MVFKPILLNVSCNLLYLRCWSRQSLSYITHLYKLVGQPTEKPWKLLYGYGSLHSFGKTFQKMLVHVCENMCPLCQKKGISEVRYRCLSRGASLFQFILKVFIGVEVCPLGGQLSFLVQTVILWSWKKHRSYWKKKLLLINFCHTFWSAQLNKLLLNAVELTEPFTGDRTLGEVSKYFWPLNMIVLCQRMDFY